MWYGAPDKGTGDIGAVRYRWNGSMILTPARALWTGNRGAAYGPATVRNLRGRFSGSEARIDLAPEGNVVDIGPGVVYASDSSKNAGVRSDVGVGNGIPAAFSLAPHETVRRMS